jgi:hypothetical protein
MKERMKKFRKEQGYDCVGFEIEVLVSFLDGKKREFGGGVYGLIGLVTYIRRGGKGKGKGKGKGRNYNKGRTNDRIFDDLKKCY